MNDFAILCFILDLLLTVDEQEPMQPTRDIDLITVCNLSAGILPGDSLSCLVRIQTDGLIRVGEDGTILLTQKGVVSARRARFLLDLAQQDPTLN